MKKLSKLYMSFVMMFLYVPILVLIFFSFNDTKSKTVFTGFTFDWYLKLFNNGMIISSLRNTLIIAIIASVVATILGTAAAIGINRMRKTPKSVVMNITNIPIINPEIVTGVSLMLLFAFFAARIHFEFGFITLLIAHITFDVPYVILNVLPKLKQMNPNLYEAAQDLGCNPAQAFFKVILPEIMPGVLSGFLMAFVFSLDDFIISLFTTGPTFQTLPVTIYSMTRRRVSPQINALSTIIFIVVAIVLITKNIPERKNKEKQTKYIKRTVAVILTGAICFVLFFKGNDYTPMVSVEDEDYYKQFYGDGVSINVYNWGEYISDGSDSEYPDINREFELLTGIKVNYTTYSTNEELYAKLKGNEGTYDIIIPSDYMIARMINEGMLEKINYDNIPNIKYIGEAYRSKNYDPENEYSVPYTWGTVGIIYNKDMVEEKDFGWEILWDKKYADNILMFDNPRDAFAISQNMLGYSMNTENIDELEAAAEKLKEQKPLVQAYVMDEIFDKMGAGSAALAPYYAGDAKTLMDEFDFLGFKVPESGTNSFYDAVCIPKGAKNKEAAEMYINFLCEPEVAYHNINYIGYSTPNIAAYEMLDDEVKNDGFSYPDVEYLENNTEVFKNLSDEVNRKMQELWVEMKSEK